MGLLPFPDYCGIDLLSAAAFLCVKHRVTIWLCAWKYRAPVGLKWMCVCVRVGWTNGGLREVHQDIGHQGIQNITSFGQHRILCRNNILVHIRYRPVIVRTSGDLVVYCCPIEHYVFNRALSTMCSIGYVWVRYWHYMPISHSVQAISIGSIIVLQCICAER